VPLTVWPTGSGDVKRQRSAKRLDIQGFVNVILSGPPPSPGVCAGDMNGDGS